MASLWAFRFLLFYICILCVQPQNRFTFLHSMHIADISVMAAVGLHLVAVAQEGQRFLRLGPATISALLLIMFSFISLHTGAWQSNANWNPNNDIIFKNSLVLILVEAMAFTVQRVWAVQATLMFATLWWVKGGLRLAAAGATYAGDRLMGPSVSLIENPNGFAYMMTVMIPLYLYFFQKAPNKILRWGFLALTIFSVYIVLETGSRTGVIALLAVGLFLLPKYGAKHKLALAIAAPIIFLVIGAISPGNIERFKTIPESARRFFAGVDEEANPDKMTQDQQSAWERKMKNKHTWKLIKDYPLFGVGVNPDDASFIDWEKYPYAYGQVHNEFLYAGKQMGAIGIILYLSLMYHVYQGGRRSQKAAKGWWPAAEDLGWTIKMQALVFATGGFFSPVPWNPLYLVLAGSSSALAYNLRKGFYSKSDIRPPN